MVVPGGPAEGAGPGRPLDANLLALLRMSGLEVQAPRALPEWARDLVPEVAAGPGFTRLTWRRTLDAGDPLVVEVGADLVLEVTEERSSAVPPGDVDLQTPQRPYRVSAACPALAPIDRASWRDGGILNTVALAPAPCDGSSRLAPHDVLLVADSLAPPGQDAALGAAVADAAVATAPDGFAPEQLEGSESPEGPPFGEVGHLSLVHPDGTAARLGPGTTAPGAGGAHYLDQLGPDIFERQLADGRPVSVVSPVSGSQHELTFRAGGDRLVLLSLQGPSPVEGGAVVAPSVDLDGGLAWAERIVAAVE